MTQHTPGPWHVRPNNGGRFTLIDQQSSDPSSEESRANARLISAAPELLEACEQVYKNGLGQPELFLLEKAIAKATGDANDC